MLALASGELADPATGYNARACTSTGGHTPQMHLILVIVKFVLDGKGIDRNNTHRLDHIWHDCTRWYGVVRPVG